MRIRGWRSQPRRVIAAQLVIVGLLLAWGSAYAQPSDPSPAPTAPTAPTAPSTTTTTDPLPVPTTPPAEPACVPACRTGFVCVHGACVSACNPPCGANETCTATQECKANAPPPPPPAATMTPPPADPTPRAERKGVRTHDGFFFRIALGLGAYFGDGTMRDNSRDSYEGTINSLALVGELSLGGTVGRGVVLGVGNWNAVALGPTMKGRSLNPAGAEREVSDPVVLPFGVAGGFLDWYVNPKEGFHVQTAVGFATGGYEEPGDNYDTITLTGIGGMIGIGHEWWIGEEWSMGILARGTLASVSGTDPTDANEEHSAILASPGVLLTFSYH